MKYSPPTSPEWRRAMSRRNMARPLAAPREIA
jgi:hypothetical protein